MRIQGRKSGIIGEIYIGTDRVRDLHLFNVLFQGQDASKRFLCQTDSV
jgi:hypothetical protein